MALHSTLPIYKLAYDLLDLATDLTRSMPRDFKNSLGAQIRNECVSMLVLIGRANAARDKLPHLDAMLECQHVIEMLLRLSHDKGFIRDRRWARSIDVIGRIGKQGGGWRKAEQQRPLHVGHGLHA